MSLDDKIKEAVRRSKREHRSAVARVAVSEATSATVQKHDTQEPEPRTAADYEQAEAPAGWTLGEAWSLLWPQIKPIAAYAGVVGYTAAWWAAQASVWVAVAHAAASSAAVAAAAVWLPPRITRRRVVIGGTAAVAWLVIALATGPSYSILVAGWLVMLALATRYWQQRRPDYPEISPVEVDLPPVPASPVATGLVADWDTYATGVFPGSRLEFQQTTRYTHDYKLYLKRGRQTTGKVAAELQSIASALDVMPDKILLEPESGEDASPTRMDLKHIHTSPVKGITPYAGPQFRDGIVTLGPHVDGIGESGVRVYQGGSLWSTFISGDTGSGKSRVAETIAVGSVSDPLQYPTILLYTDPQGGMSSPALMQGAAKSSGVADIWPLLTSVAAVAELRQKEFSQEGEIGFRCRPCTCGTGPAERVAAMTSGTHRAGCPYKPGILWIIDECHSVLEDKAVRLVIERLARETRKVGIGLLLASQHGTLDAAFAGSQVLRSSLLAGNAVSLRTEDRMSSQVLGFEYDTRALPPQGYLVAKQTVEGNRPVPARCVPPIDPIDTSRSTADEWLAQCSRLALPTVEQEVVGNDWFCSAYAANQEDEDTGREHIDIRPGNQQVREYVYARLDKRLGTNLRQMGNPVPVVPQQSAFGDLMVPSYNQLVAEVEDALLDVQPQPAGTTTETPRPGTREYTRQQVYEHLAAGATSPGDVAEQLGMADRYVRDLLTELEQVGQTRKTSRGRWEVIG